MKTVRDRGAKFLDRLNRGTRASAHVRTVLGDAVVDTYNTAQLVRGTVLGSPGAVVHDALLGDTDEACEQADGETWTLAYAIAHKKEHPNCTREFTLIVPGTPFAIDRGELPGVGPSTRDIGRS